MDAYSEKAEEVSKQNVSTYEEVEKSDKKHLVTIFMVKKVTSI